MSDERYRAMFENKHGARKLLMPDEFNFIVNDGCTYYSNPEVANRYFGFIDGVDSAEAGKVLFTKPKTLELLEILERALDGNEVPSSIALIMKAQKEIQKELK
jgi:hypothetical protein